MNSIPTNILFTSLVSKKKNIEILLAFSLLNQTGNEENKHQITFLTKFLSSSTVLNAGITDILSLYFYFIFTRIS